MESALHNLGKEIINEHLTHCISHAIEDGNKEAIEVFQKAIKNFFKNISPHPACDIVQRLLK